MQNVVQHGLRQLDIRDRLVVQTDGYAASRGERLHRHPLLTAPRQDQHAAFGTRVFDRRQHQGPEQLLLHDFP